MTFIEEQIQCVVCGKSRTISVLASAGFLGGTPDLDLRDGDMARRALLHAITACPTCHYCSLPHAVAATKAKQTLASPAYKGAFENQKLPVLARHWHCWALIQEAEGDRKEAGQAFLRAAWVCDDEKKLKSAKWFRLQALQAFLAYLPANATAASDFTTATICIDLLRRVGDFAKAAQQAQAVLLRLPQSSSDEIAYLRKIIHFQLHVIAQSDARRYQYREAQQFEAAPLKWRSPRWWEFWR